MAAPNEKLPSLGDLTHMERKTFTKQRDHCLTNSKVRQLQQRWQELKERELRAQQHNKELLQQFEKAQDTLKEMLDCTAAMKTIRMEYERYLKESAPRWQQQLKEKTQAAQRMRMEDNLRSCLKNTKEAEVTKAYADQRSQGCIEQTQHIAGTQNKDCHHIPSDYNQDSSPYHPYVQASWLTHAQSQAAGIPMRASHQPQSSSHVPPSFLPHPHPFVLHHLSSTPSHHPWPWQNAPGQSSLQTDGPWSWIAGAAGLPEALWGQLYNKEPPTELMASPTVAQGSEISAASRSSRERCGGRRSSCLSQELDIKPVRLSSGHAESSESGMDSTQVIRERRKKEKRGRSQCTSLEKQSHSSEGSSRTSSAVIIASAAVVQSSERDVSSGKGKKRRQRSGVQVAESLSIEKVLKEKNRNEGDESASQHSSEESGRETEESTGEKAGNSSADDKSEECSRKESGSICIQLKSKAGDEKQKQEIISSEQSSSEEKDADDEHEEDLGGENKTEEKENSLEGDDQDGDVEDEPDEKDKCLKEKEQDKKDEEEADEEEEKATEDEMEEQECKVKDELKKDDCDESSAFSQEEEDESEQDQTEEDEEGSEEEEQEESEEQRSDKEEEPEEESDSEESATLQQEKRRRHIIPEEAAEDDEEKAANKAGLSDGDDSNDCSEEDDIENLLTPQEQRQKREDKDPKPAEKLKVPDMKTVQAEDGRSTKITPQHSNSDEFDHFYD